MRHLDAKQGSMIFQGAFDVERHHRDHPSTSFAIERASQLKTPISLLGVCLSSIFKSALACSFQRFPIRLRQRPTAQQFLPTWSLRAHCRCLGTVHRSVGDKQQWQKVTWTKDVIAHKHNIRRIGRTVRFCMPGLRLSIECLGRRLRH